MLTPLRGKVKAARVPLDYFKGTSPRKWAWTGGVGLGALLLVLIVNLPRGPGLTVAQPGELHFVHATWEQNCATCHAPFQPTSDNNPFQSILGTGAVSDQLCRACHAGPPHHPEREIAAEVGGCASCHREHRGRYQPLSSMPDSACTRCHADLDAHVSDGVARYEKRITRFEHDHPQFNLGKVGQRQPLGKARDPGKLHFSHQVHLTLDIRQPAKGRGSRAPERYRKLDCASCHQLDAGEASPPGAGDYMQPIRYAQHCAACHPLTFAPDLPAVQVPHPLRPDEVRRFLWGALVERETKSLPKKLVNLRPLPGHNLSREEQAVRDRLRPQVEAVQTFLFQDDLRKTAQFVFSGQTTCGLCHHYQPKEGSRPPLDIVPPAVPQIWFPHGKFSHRAHRAVECRQCHAGADDSPRNTDVLLPGVANCRSCHAPPKTVANHRIGGVRHSCVTCHRYHNGDTPSAGRGAETRGAQRRSIQDFLDGK